MNPLMHPGGPAARSIAALGWGVLSVFALVAVLMWILVAWVGLRRQGSFDRHAPVEDAGDKRWIYIGGVLVPSVVLGVIMILGLHTLAAFPLHGQEMAGAPDIRIIGHQWWWEIEYRTGDTSTYVTSANELHLPAGRSTDIELITRDVIHSFWVPELHGKVDLVPGLTNRIRVEPDREGQFLGQCAEYCGREHGRMRLFVTSLDPVSHASWLAHEQLDAADPAPGSLAETGRTLFMREQCTFCHAIRGTPAHGHIGPDLTHFGSRPGLAANAYPNDDQHLETWIGHAQSMKSSGMPNLPVFTDAELAAVAAYLRGLK